MKSIFTMLGLLAVLLPGCQKPSGQPLPEKDTTDFRACATADDCVYAENGCCDCANGGEEIAINKSKIAAFRAMFQCTGCTERAGTCGTGRIACEQGLCVYHRERAPNQAP